VGREPEGVRASADGRWVLVTSEGDNSVSIIDAHSHVVRRTVAVGARPRDLAFAPDGHSAYVPGEADASLYRVGLAAGTAPARVLQFRKEARPMGVALDAARGRLYVSTGHGGSVAVITLPDATLESEIPVGGRPWGIALSADGQRLCTANGPAGDVAVIDANTLSVLGKVRTGHGPWAVVLGP
jgi:YVTN family beta-propeller protein